jgi:hypothetical protein
MYNSTLKITDNFPRGLKLNLKFYAKVIIVDDESSGRKLIKIFRVLSGYFIVGEANSSVDAVKY